jgi:Ca-activated chloride channel family protein
MPTFVHPWVLTLLVLVPLLAWKQRRPAALALPLASVGHDNPSRRLLWRRRLLPILQILTGLFLICGLSGPRIRGASTLDSEGIALGLVLDVSGSMATEDSTWDGKPVSRLDAVRNVFHLLVAGGKSPDGLEFPGRPSDRIALVPFAVRPETACPLTFDHSALLSILDRQKAKTDISEATTNPGDALAWTLELLRKAPMKNKAIVFVTDGESNVGPPALTPLQAGQLAVALGIPIHTVDALSDADISGDAESAHRSLADLAKLTGGQHLKAGDGSGLAKAMHDLDQLERDRLPTAAARHLVDASGWFALAALGCLFTALALSSGPWRTTP